MNSVFHMNGSRIHTHCLQTIKMAVDLDNQKNKIFEENERQEELPHQYERKLPQRPPANCESIYFYCSVVGTAWFVASLFVLGLLAYGYMSRSSQLGIAMNEYKHCQAGVVQCREQYKDDLEEHKKQCQTELEGCKKRYQTDLDECKKQHQTDLKGCKKWRQTELEGCKKQHQTDLEECKKRYQTDLDECKKQHQTDLKGCKKRHQTELEGCKKQYQTDLEERKKRHQTDIRECNTRCKADLEEWKKQYKFERKHSIKQEEEKISRTDECSVTKSNLSGCDSEREYSRIIIGVLCCILLSLLSCYCHWINRRDLVLQARNHSINHPGESDI